MLKHVLLSATLCGAAFAANAEEQWLLTSACFTRSSMQEVVELPEDDGILLMAQHIGDRKCAPVVISQSEVDAGAEIPNTGVLAAYGHVFNWLREESITPALLPPKQVMYFNASVRTE